MPKLDDKQTKYPRQTEHPSTKEFHVNSIKDSKAYYNTIDADTIYEHSFNHISFYKDGKLVASCNNVVAWSL